MVVPLPYEPCPESGTALHSCHLGDKGKPENPEPTTCELALSEEISFWGQLTQGASGDSQLGQPKDQDGFSEMQGEHLRPGLDSQKEKLPGKVSPKHDGLGTADGVCSRVIQDQVSLGDDVRDCDSHGSGENP
ncbi:hypothetical protein H8959_005531, partial [Pygathrix nigripes]